MRRLRAALYTRVSTGDQQTIPMQTAALRKYAKQRGWEIAAEVREIGSGAATRPQREDLMKRARRREIDAVLVWKLDRWGRSVADLAVSLKELHGLGVAFVSLTEALDLTTPSGRAMAGLLSVFAEFERDILRERVIAGLAAARERGVRIGRPATARAKRDEALQLQAAGLSPGRIAKKLGLGRTSVRRLLTSSETRETSADRRARPAGRRRERPAAKAPRRRAR
jgi:putative DNA-invertase from lambdoid prophage Rac